MKTRIKADPLVTMKSVSFQKISTFLWFNNQAEEAARFYTQAFKNARVKTVTRYNRESAAASGMPEGSVMTVAFDIEGAEFVGLNGGPAFQLNPSVSFMVNCRTIEKVDHLWSTLTADGKILMELDEYPFSERYGWVEDKYGVSWQINFSDEDHIITPCLMFTGEQHGKAEEALNFYMSVFQNSAVEKIIHYEPGEDGPTGAVKYSAFSLNGHHFCAMDSGIDVPFRFNPGVSFMVHCNTQAEIDHYWDLLSEGGAPQAQQCGWLSDKYGVAWQIVPSQLEVWVSGDNENSRQVMNALLKMKKLNLEELQHAYNISGISEKEAQLDLDESIPNLSSLSKDSLTPNEEL
jgi:predicted 3-demethylubiquinone-9 3-methyltransferase (glyoxalase superfamily)